MLSIKKLSKVFDIGDDIFSKNLVRNYIQTSQVKPYKFSIINLVEITIAQDIKPLNPNKFGFDLS